MTFLEFCGRMMATSLVFMIVSVIIAGGMDIVNKPIDKRTKLETVICYLGGASALSTIFFFIVSTVLLIWS